jgi:phage-related minor tail protein
MTLSVAPLTTVVMNAVGERQAGVASGINNTAARVAGVLAVAALTAVAVGQFSDELARRLRDQGVPDRLIEELAMNASQLAELQPPAGIAESSADAITDSIALAYVAAFRRLVIVCGLLSAVSGLVAWLTLNGAAGATRRPPA